ncbi:hypothetical protein [Burkholderia thailandensis]|uniref:hypothetical protein n=2 Tax=Burkholderia thailandensis TaxID=57975 RepID=UPI0011B236CE|nr:hypothetical protein [Burkholderia thailandensis]
MSDARMPPLNSGYFVAFGQGAMCADIRIRLTDRQWIGGGSAVRWRWVGGALAAPTATHENRPS